MTDSNKRVYSLDYLRGIAALGVMMFHYHTWLKGKPESHSIFTKLGVYNVEIFYILSGLTLYLVYKKVIQNPKEFAGGFFIKRIFRIFPLLWLTIILTIVVRGLTPNFLTLFYNFTGLFGIVERRSYIPQGAWSIGNELVFYVFFPVLLYLLTFKKSLFWLVCAMFLGAFIYFSFFALSTTVSLEDQWLIYINPFNQAIYFVAGILLGYFFNDTNIKTKYNLTILIVSLAVFALYPVHGNRIFLASGITRVVYSVLCIAVCFAFYKNTITFPRYLHSPLAKLGEMSYALYLVHPIVYFAYKKLHIPKNIPHHNLVIAASLAAVIVLTFVLSSIIHYYFEVFFIKKGKDFMTFLKKKPVTATS